MIATRSTAREAADGESSGPLINIGLLPLASPGSDQEVLAGISAHLIAMVGEVLNRGTGASWHLHPEDPVRADTGGSKLPADFLDAATAVMAEGPYDALIVVTDLPLVSRRQQLIPGIASSVARVAVISLRKLTMTPRGEATRRIDSDSVRWNAATLLLHLIGHLLDLEHDRDDPVMRPFRFDRERRSVPELTPSQRLRDAAAELPDREHDSSGAFDDLLFHLRSALRHPIQLLRPLIRSRAILLPLSLPSLATAAVAPSILLIFTAEIWDAGLGMSPTVVFWYATATILAATWYLIAVQNLLFPRKEKRIITEHLAVVNVSIVLSILIAIIGLFLMLSGLMLILEMFIFPPGLIRTWPTLDLATVTLLDKIRLAAFISTIGVATGALAGGLESRTAIRHLALFPKEP